MIKNTLLLCSLLVTSLALTISTTSAQNTRTSAAESAEQFTTTLSETEFTQLLIASLARDKNGQKLLSVTNSIKTKVHGSHIEFSAVINLDKVEKVSPQARKSFEKFDAFLFFVDNNNLNITVFGEPVVRNGLISIRDNFSIKLGPIPISNSALRQLGVNVKLVNTTHLKLNDLSLTSISLESEKVILGTAVKP